MKRLILSEGQIIDFDILTQKILSDYLDPNLIIYFVLDGEAEITINGDVSLLKMKDFLLINSYQHHSYHMTPQSLVVRFVVSVEEISKYYNIQKVEFCCNSTRGKAEQDNAFRGLLETCISNYYGKTAGDGKTLIRLNSIYYQILESLVSNYAEYSSGDVEGSLDPDEERIQSVIRYIHANYKRQISLNDLSEKMYLSTAYISRYIKKKLGKNLLEYLTEIRLDYAVKDLENTDKTIARVALDNGFPNIASFNKAFKERYDMTPKRYQEKCQIEMNGMESERLSGNIERHFIDYLKHREDGVLEKQDCLETFTVDVNQHSYLKKTWNRMINIGCLISLLRSDVQEHVLFLKDNLQIEYVRLWDIYDENLQLNVTNQAKKHNFSKLDKAIDFLVDHQLRPYLELGFKPIILKDSYDTYLSYKEREVLFSNAAEYGRYLRLMMIHFVNRYGASEVSKWYFEQWCDPRLFEKGNSQRYFETFETAYNIIKEIVPEAKIGGSYDRSYGVIDYRKLIVEWSKRKIQPDFMSLYCYRTLLEEAMADSRVLAQELQGPDFLIKYLRSKKKILKENGMDIPVIISEWNMTVFNCNVLNDSCYKGAYVMKNLMQLYSEVEMAGYWFGTDLYIDYEEAPKILDGYCGLISYHGIRKPAFFAMDFMNRLGQYLLGQTDNMMVATNEYDDYTIVCHNYKHLGVQYYMQDEKDIHIEKIPLLFDDLSRLKITVQLNNVKNGLYYVKTRSISNKNGSIQDEWLNMGLIENLNAKDIDYLKQISMPRITIYKQVVTNNILEISIFLDPHEIQCVHIYKQIEEICI